MRAVELVRIRPFNGTREVFRDSGKLCFRETRLATIDDDKAAEEIRHDAKFVGIQFQRAAELVGRKHSTEKAGDLIGFIQQRHHGDDGRNVCGAARQITGNGGSFGFSRLDDLRPIAVIKPDRNVHTERIRGDRFSLSVRKDKRHDGRIIPQQRLQLFGLSRPQRLQIDLRRCRFDQRTYLVDATFDLLLDETRRAFVHLQGLSVRLGEFVKDLECTEQKDWDCGQENRENQQEGPD